MVLSTDDKHDLQFIEWPYINPTVSLSDSDHERLEMFFFKMKARQSRATVNEIINFITTKDKAPHFTPWIIEGIRKVARRFFPDSDGWEHIFKTGPPER